MIKAKTNIAGINLITPEKIIKMKMIRRTATRMPPGLSGSMMIPLFDVLLLIMSVVVKLFMSVCAVVVEIVKTNNNAMMMVMERRNIVEICFIFCLVKFTVK